jgi:ribonuclease BN (tRNA processing enzyme)
MQNFNTVKLIFLGTGSAYTLGSGNYQSNMLLQSPGGKNLLIDCGGDIRFSLYEQGLSYADIDAVYVSHLHADHIGGLEWLAINTLFDTKKKPQLFVHESLVNPLWNHSLAGGLTTLEDAVINLETYFDVKPIDQSFTFAWEGLDFEIVQTEHIHLHEGNMPSYGLIIKGKDANYFITTDTQFTPERLMPYYEGATLVFHDCETSLKRTDCHAHYEDLATLTPEIKNKMWLYHYQTGALPDAEKDGFKGFLKKGATFNLLI